jgi:hypothetical protein
VRLVRPGDRHATSERFRPLLLGANGEPRIKYGKGGVTVTIGKSQAVELPARVRRRSRV